MAWPRKTILEVIYAGRDITEAVSNTVLNFTYTDHASGEADEVQLNVHDREGHWRSDWYPKVTNAKADRSDDFSAIAKALTNGVSTDGLQALIDQTNLTPAQGETLQRITDAARWMEFVRVNPQYRGEAGKLRLREDIKRGGIT
jgi:hypothetical protein